MIYNVYGDVINANDLELIDSSFGYRNEKGQLIVNWDPESDIIDNNGFDKTNVEENGEYYMDIELPKGTILIRYGRATGKMTAPYGTPYELLSLPYKIETVEYHQYRVIADGVKVKCVVRRGKVQKMFGKCGGGIQYMHDSSIANEIAEEKLEEDLSWIQKKTSDA